MHGAGSTGPRDLTAGGLYSRNLLVRAEAVREILADRARAAGEPDPDLGACLDVAAAGRPGSRLTRR